MGNKTSQPPKWADRLLSWFCKADILEIIQGDLHEIHQQRVSDLGRKKANQLYVRDVMGILRPKLIKTLEGARRLNQYGIFKNYLKTSLRSIKRNPVFSGINVVGLAISMSVGILMIVLLSELSSFDDFHEKKDRIYRVTTTKQALLEGEEEYFATASHYIAGQIEAQAPGIEQVLVLRRGLTADLKTKDHAAALNGYYATASFFDVLSFQLKSGHAETALEDPGAIVLTESAARRLFGDADPMGKTVTVEDNQDFRIGIITGVMEDPPIHSHLVFDMLVSMKTMENSLVPGRRGFKDNPGNYAQSYVYLVLSDGADVAEITSLMATIMAEYNAQKAPIALSLQPMDEFVTGGAAYPPGPSFSKQKIDMMAGLTLIVLLSACFNYTNLSLARALRRSREISVRKVIGASRFQVFAQFMTEAIVLSVIAAAVGTGIFFIIRPGFLNLPHLAAGDQVMFQLAITPIYLLYFLLFAVVAGAVAGFLPALFLSKLKANVFFKDAGKARLFFGGNVRQALIMLQFVLSIGLIMCAAMVHKQYEYVLNYDLGYDTENIVNIGIEGDYIEVLENEYAKMPEVLATSRSSVVLGTRNAMPGDAMSEDRSEGIMFFSNYVSSNYLNMHGFELIAGNGFTAPSKGEETPKSIIVNEGFLKELKLGSPEEAIGKHVWYFEDTRLKIQGVVKDFISMSLDAESPAAFGFLPGAADQTRVLGVKIASADLLSTMEKLEKSFRALDPIHPFQATFYGDEIARTYEDSKTTFTIISFLAFLAISISTLGLLGMAVFTTESRMKEISIRKVLGAGIRDLMLLLSRGFLVMIAIAGVVTIPVTLYIVDDMILNKFLHRADIGILEMLSGLAIVLVIGMLTVGWQVRTAAAQNPADLLRNE